MECYLAAIRNIDVRVNSIANSFNLNLNVLQSLINCSVNICGNILQSILILFGPSNGSEFVLCLLTTDILA